jgi:hypothetical protein
MSQKDIDPISARLRNPLGRQHRQRRQHQLHQHRDVERMRRADEECRQQSPEPADEERCRDEVHVDPLVLHVE